MPKNSDAAETSEAENPLNAPGFHVTVDKKYVGTYPTQDDAQAFIDGHITPQHLEAKIVEGKETASEE